MGEWTIHIDTPEGHLARRHQRDRRSSSLKELERDRGRRADRAVDRRERARRRRGDAHPLPRARRCRSTSASTRRSRSSRRCGSGWPRIPATSRASRRATRSAAAKAAAASPISANILGPDLDQLADYSLKALAAAQKLPSLAEAEDFAEHLEPGDSRRGRSPARRRPRRADVDDRQHAAAGGGRRRRDLELPRRRRSSTRSRSACSRTSGATSTQIGRLTVPSATRAGADRQHRARSSAASGRARCSARTGSSRCS